MVWVRRGRSTFHSPRLFLQPVLELFQGWGSFCGHFLQQGISCTTPGCSALLGTLCPCEEDESRISPAFLPPNSRAIPEGISARIWSASPKIKPKQKKHRTCHHQKVTLGGCRCSWLRVGTPGDMDPVVAPAVTTAELVALGQGTGMWRARTCHCWHSQAVYPGSQS